MFAQPFSVVLYLMPQCTLGLLVLITCAIIGCLDYSDFNVLAIIYLPCLLLKFFVCMNVVTGHEASANMDALCCDW